MAVVHAEYGGMLRWAKIEADDVGRLGFELRIVAGHVAFETVRLQASLFPNAMDGVFADAQHRGQLAAAPVCGSVAWLSPRDRQYPGPQSRGQHTGLLAGMIGVQSIQSILPE